MNSFISLEISSTRSRCLMAARYCPWSLAEAAKPRIARRSCTYNQHAQNKSQGWLRIQHSFIVFTQLLEATCGVLEGIRHQTCHVNYLSYKKSVRAVSTGKGWNTLPCHDHTLSLKALLSMSAFSNLTIAAAPFLSFNSLLPWRNASRHCNCSGVKSSSCIHNTPSLTRHHAPGKNQSIHHTVISTCAKHQFAGPL